MNKYKHVYFKIMVYCFENLRWNNLYGNGIYSYCSKVVKLAIDIMDRKKLAQAKHCNS